MIWRKISFTSSGRMRWVAWLVRYSLVCSSMIFSIFSCRPLLTFVSRKSHTWFGCSARSRMQLPLLSWRRLRFGCFCCSRQARYTRLWLITYPLNRSITVIRRYPYHPIFSRKMHYLLSDFILFRQAYIAVPLSTSALANNPTCPSLTEPIGGDNLFPCGSSLGRA